MILVDTSVWIDHFRRGNHELTVLSGAKLWTLDRDLASLAKTLRVAV